jgi:hypothetical protein
LLELGKLKKAPNLQEVVVTSFLDRAQKTRPELFSDLKPV